MSTTTPNLNLVKPDGNERALVSDINGNMDLIDSAVGDLQDSVSHTNTFTSDSFTVGANSVIGVNINVAENGFEPIGVIQHQFANGSANLVMSNCVTSGNSINTGVANRSSSAITTTLKVVVLYRKLSS